MDWHIWLKRFKKKKVMKFNRKFYKNREFGKRKGPNE